MEFLGSESINFNFSTDIEFYSCNILYWQNKLIDIGLKIPSVINNDQEVEYCKNLLLNKGFNSGPIFPLILYLNRLMSNTNINLRILFIIFWGIYLFLSNQIIIFENNKKRIFFNSLLLFAPVLIWLTIYPSTDLIFSVFWLFSLFIFKKYLRKNFYNEDIKDIKFIYFVLPILFSSSLIFSILIRPGITLCISLFFIWFFYDFYILFFLVKKSIKRKFKSIYFYNIFVLIFSTFILFKLHYLLYSDYGSGAINKFHMYFYSFSPPAPIGLKQSINSSLFSISHLLKDSQYNLFTLITEIIRFLILAFNHCIYGFISISGLQIKSSLQTETAISFRYISSLIKSFYGLFIILPSLYITLYNFYKYIKEILLKKFNYIFKKENYFNFAITFLAMSHIMISIILMPHVRYLLPILPLLVNNLSSNKKFFKLKF